MTRCPIEAVYGFGQPSGRYVRAGAGPCRSPGRTPDVPRAVPGPGRPATRVHGRGGGCAGERRQAHRPGAAAARRGAVAVPCGAGHRPGHRMGVGLALKAPPVTSGVHLRDTGSPRSARRPKAPWRSSRAAAGARPPQPRLAESRRTAPPRHGRDRLSYRDGGSRAGPPPDRWSPAPRGPRAERPGAGPRASGRRLRLRGPCQRSPARSRSPARGPLGAAPSASCPVAVRQGRAICRDTGRHQRSVGSSPAGSKGRPGCGSATR